jgi:hypothetical protein
MDTNQFIDNCNRYPDEKLLPLLGKHVAWSTDGTEILAHANTLAELFVEVDRLGLTDYVADYLPRDEFFGGGLTDISITELMADDSSTPAA